MRTLARRDRAHCDGRAVGARCARGRRHEQGHPRRVSRSPRPASIPRRRTTCTRRTIEQAIFETLYTYDYLARPAKLVPLTAEAMPRITDDGKTYTIKLQQGHLLRAPIRRSAARSASSSRTTSSIRSSASPIRRSARRRRSWSRASSSASTSSPRRRRRPASSTTTRRSPGLEAVDRYTIRFR